MRRVTVLACAFAALTAPAWAGPREDIAKVEKANKACMDKAGTTMEYADCAGTAHGDADGILNKVYQSIVAGLPDKTGDETTDADNKETLRRLKAAQRAWIAWRDAECDLQGAQMLGGTGENVTIEDCLFTLTADRVKALEDQFDSGR